MNKRCYGYFSTTWKAVYRLWAHGIWTTKIKSAIKSCKFLLECKKSTTLFSNHLKAEQNMGQWPNLRFPCLLKNIAILCKKSAKSASNENVIKATTAKNKLLKHACILFFCFCITDGISLYGIL